MTSSNPVDAQLSSRVVASQKTARQALRAIVTLLQYLAAQGLAICGNSDKNGNLAQLVNLRANDIPELKQWLQRKDTWTSNIVHNEIIEMLAHSVQRDIAHDIQQSPYFAVVADGTTDISGLEQLSITVQHASVHFKSYWHYLHCTNFRLQLHIFKLALHILCTTAR